MYAVPQAKQVVVFFLDHCDWFQDSKTFQESLSYCLYLLILLETKQQHSLTQKLYELVRNIQFTWRFLRLQKNNLVSKDQVALDDELLK